ncbi:MAG: geranylgeranylglycerol-phosphate geranylgeranyltransferase [Gemmatimonadetes bacterium]|nr:geranylgeranylglycerol-phosphate geranylgeranyltransferase [Gemmatimonadota bacterium]
MTDVFRLIRLPNLVLAAAAILAGGWIALERVGWTPLLGWAALSGMGLGAAGNALNDLHDAPADALNRPAGARPLVAGRLSRGAAELCVFAGTLVGLTAAALVSGTLVFIGFLAFAVMVVYSPLLKRRGVPGNVAVAVVAGLPLFYGSATVDRPAAGLVPWAVAAWLHLVREVVKDLEDEPGDRAVGRRTLPITLGPARARQVAVLLALGFIPVSLALPWAAGFGDAYFAVAAIAQLVVVAAALRLRRGRLTGASLLLKGAMVAGLIALVAGRVA